MWFYEVLLDIHDELLCKRRDNVENVPKYVLLQREVLDP